ncbi:DUF4956 domain-containing protein [Actinomyces israelii]|uniref:DUF4956 domain-containing protein n=1 Tax=Actinomyces israelii TaxID=1659 RepID=A0ABT4I7C0_9ACTO|nr:DUF4956 domain-containing protein [Actinomyces israelii]MCZ0857269.1 DUF4956 domain-containing protein [Actinomyces israelii]
MTVASLAAICADLVALSALVGALYARRHSRKDLMAAYIGVNVGVLAVTLLLATSDVGAGLGLGLFGVLSIIRLRSTELAQHEVAYFFAALALGLLGGIGASLVTTAVLMALVVASLWIGDHPALLSRSRHQVVMVDRAIADEPALTDHLAHLLNARIHSIDVQRLDLVNDTTLVDVRYRVRPPGDQDDAPRGNAPALAGRAHSLAGLTPTLADLERPEPAPATVPTAASPAGAWNPAEQVPPSYHPQGRPQSTAATRVTADATAR